MEREERKRKGRHVGGKHVSLMRSGSWGKAILEQKEKGKGGGGTPAGKRKKPSGVCVCKTREGRTGKALGKVRRGRKKNKMQMLKV